jgi:hypothetical protein
LVSFHRIDTPRSTTIDNVRDRSMAKGEHQRARPGDKSWRGGKVPRLGARPLKGQKGAPPPEKNVFTINALCQ